jgi:hypothetical protein
MVKHALIHLLQSVNVPKDVRKMSCLDKNIAICGEKGMLVMNPTK